MLDASGAGVMMAVSVFSVESWGGEQQCHLGVSCLESVSVFSVVSWGGEPGDFSALSS